MNKDLYIQMLTEKKEKIDYMHQVIKKSLLDNYISSIQYEVLLRGYIVLIYSFWEAGYKSLPEFFFKRFEFKKMNILPAKLKNKIYDHKILSYKLGSGSNHKIIQEKYEEFQNLKNSRVYEIFEERLELFGELSNNPKIKHLKKVQELYHMGIRVDKELENKINFIIESRNDIAHAGARVENYFTEAFDKLKIQEIKDRSSRERAASKEEKELVIDQLQNILNNIFMKFKEIIDMFDQKYPKEKLLIWIETENFFKEFEKIINKISSKHSEITILLPKLSMLENMCNNNIISRQNIGELRKNKIIHIEINRIKITIHLRTLRSTGDIKGPCLGFNINPDKFILQVASNINDNYLISDKKITEKYEKLGFVKYFLKN